MGGILGCTPYTSLWDTPWLPEMRRLTECDGWKNKGVKRVSQVLTDDNLLKSFAQLRMEFSVPNSMFYQYLQMRHAYQTEDDVVRSCVSSFEPINLIQTRISAKGLISILYRYLLHAAHSKSLLLYRTRWEGDLGPIEDGVWDEILSMIPQISLSEQHRLSHIYLIHRVYRTPLFLHKIGVRGSPLCNRCNIHPAGLLHMFWNCPKLVRYWEKVLDHINVVFSISIDATPLTCVLGHVEDLSSTPEIKLAIARVLYMARKVIARHWLDSQPPTFVEFVNKVQWLISLEKGIYLKRDMTAKFEKIWTDWMAYSGPSGTHRTRHRVNPLPS